MSACISRNGEYDSHHLGSDGFTCEWCGVFDEAAALAEIERLRARTQPVAPQDAATEACPACGSRDDDCAECSIRLFPICAPCVRAEGQECHTPGCALWLHDVPSDPLNVDLAHDWPAEPAPQDAATIEAAIDAATEAVEAEFVSINAGSDHGARDVAEAAVDAIAAAGMLAGGDEYHTLDELYEYRMLYNAHAAVGWLAAGIPVAKSWRHSDGEPCFGGGWFIVTATLSTGQVSNHYKAEFWDLFAVPEVELPPVYDGHTPADAAARLREELVP